MTFESFPGIKTMALGYLMDNGLMDDAPKQALALHVPGAKDSSVPLAQPVSTAQTTPPGSEADSQPERGGGMSHPESAPGLGVRDTTRNVSPQPQPQPPEKPFFEPQPNGDLRIGDDTYLRWKKLPDPSHDAIASALVGGSGLIGRIGKGASKIADAAGYQLPPLAKDVLAWTGGFTAEHQIKGYLDEHFRWPWLEYEPAPQQPSPQDNTPDQVPKPTPQDNTQDQVPNA